MSPRHDRAHDSQSRLARDVAHDRRRQIELQRLPVIASIERHVHTRDRAGIEQVRIFRIFADDARWSVAAALEAARAYDLSRPDARLPAGSSVRPC